MSVTSQLAQPVWARDAFLRAFWVATGESPEWIAERTDGLLRELQAVASIASWKTYKGDRWEGSLETLADIVRRFVVRDRPVGDAVEGGPLADEGYSFIVSGAGARVAVEVRVAAGAAVLAARLPMHTLFINLRETAQGGVTQQIGDAACAAVASTWEPSTLTLTDSLTNRIARRGGWKIGVGYRTWICADVGAVNEIAPGLASSELAGGTLISAPDDWPAQAVVESMMATLTANGLDEVPH
jgi:hypothetical protein